jgi:hypothetical protein
MFHVLQWLHMYIVNLYFKCFICFQTHVAIVFPLNVAKLVLKRVSTVTMELSSLPSVIDAPADDPFF